LTVSPKGMSLSIHNLNTSAQRLYEGFGYRCVAQRAIVKQGWEHPATRWVLMVKP